MDIGDAASLVEALSDAVVIADSSARIVMVNSAAERLSGYAREELEGMKIEKLVPERCRERFAKGFEAFVKGDAAPKERHEGVFLRKDGSEVPVELSVSVFEFAGKRYLIAVLRDISQRKSMEDKLRASEEMFRIISENSLVGIYLIQDGVLRYANPRLAEIFGYTQEEMLGRNVLDFIYPEDVEQVKRNMEERVSGSLPAASYVLRCVRKNGEVFYAEVYGARVDYRGEPAIIGILIDATDRINAEKRIMHLNMVLNAVISINREVSRATDREELLRRVCRLLVDSGGYRGAVAYVLDNGELKRVTFAGRLCSGSRELAEEAAGKAEPVVRDSSIGLPILCDRLFGAMVLCYSGEREFMEEEIEVMAELMRDIGYAFRVMESEKLRREAEAEVRRTREFLERLIESSADAIIATDLEGRITYFSFGAREMLGYPQEEVLGRRIYELCTPESGRELKKLYDKLLEREVIRNVRLKLRCVEGKGVDVSISLAIVRDENGRPVGTVSVAKDITMEVKAERALRKAYDNLRRLEQLKSDIIANVSHELRTPITIAKGYIELAREEDDKEARRELLNTAVKALVRLNDIVDDLISVADIARGKFRLNPRKVRIGELVRRAVDEKQESAKARDVKLELQLECDVSMFADPGKLQRVLLNLIDNAIKFNRPGGRVTVRVECRDREVLFSVSDTGIGIPKERLKDIFKPLTQLDSSTTRHYGGTGTGLAVAKKVVEMHGGRIWVESIPGRGSTFYFTLPLLAAK